MYVAQSSSHSSAVREQ